MTIKEAADYCRHHERTVWAALRQYERSAGKRGLKGAQRAPNATWRVHEADADRWMRGEPPARGQFRRAS
ncbi:MAG TPA: hypothetical protein VJL80_11925 [Aeromicrobium sp.]|nr:hypothetical protein [Aeromicrobium sp.]HKY58737.1 hypothetical protein [Aeromicrobium sp.]